MRAAEIAPAGGSNSPSAAMPPAAITASAATSRTAFLRVGAGRPYPRGLRDQRRERHVVAVQAPAMQRERRDGAERPARSRTAALMAKTTPCQAAASGAKRRSTARCSTTTNGAVTK